MNEIIPVEDQELIKTYTISKIEIKAMTIKLHQSITLIVFLREENGSLIEVKNITIDGEDYAHWSTDDDYIINKVIEKCGLKRKVDPTPVEPTPAPVDPTPVESAPVEPAPVDPTPVEHAPVDPTPVEPAPVEPAPVEPAPVEPKA